MQVDIKTPGDYAKLEEMRSFYYIYETEVNGKYEKDDQKIYRSITFHMYDPEYTNAIWNLGI